MALTPRDMQTQGFGPFVVITAVPPATSLYQSQYQNFKSRLSPIPVETGSSSTSISPATIVTLWGAIRQAIARPSLSRLTWFVNTLYLPQRRLDILSTECPGTTSF